MLKKKATNAEPDLTRGEPWMREALAVADQVIAEGDGDLSAMGEFADVEYKVCRVSFHAGLSNRIMTGGSGRHATTNKSCGAAIFPPSPTLPRRHLLFPHIRPAITRAARSASSTAGQRYRRTRRGRAPLSRPRQLCHFKSEEQRSHQYASSSRCHRGTSAERGDSDSSRKGRTHACDDTQTTGSGNDAASSARVGTWNDAQEGDVREGCDVGSGMKVARVEVYVVLRGADQGRCGGI